MDAQRVDTVGSANPSSTLSTWRVEIAGIAVQANGLWMAQVARNLSDAVEGFLIGKRYLIHDHDPLLSALDSFC